MESRAATRSSTCATSTQLAVLALRDPFRHETSRQLALLALRELLRHSTSTQLALLLLRELFRHRVMDPCFHVRPFK